MADNPFGNSPLWKIKFLRIFVPYPYSSGVSPAGFTVIYILGSSLFLMDKMLFQFTRIGFCDDIHTKQRRAIF
jgi:hypothetical protein